ncbi:MAG TPA: hypothetical protein VNL16_00085 [Chloroflexota bacterium]|nr:hypothetical protein [Chloroflexota bacterium]
MPDNSMIVILKGMPRDLWARAKAKGRAEQPPRTIKAIVADLVRRWVEDPPTRHRRT